jgi:hypothetical protein
MKKLEVVRNDAERIWIAAVTQISSQSKLNIVIEKAVKRRFAQMNPREQPGEISGCMEIPARTAQWTNQRVERVCPQASPIFYLIEQPSIGGLT